MKSEAKTSEESACNPPVARLPCTPVLTGGRGLVVVPFDGVRAGDVVVPSVWYSAALAAPTGIHVSQCSISMECKYALSECDDCSVEYTMGGHCCGVVVGTDNGDLRDKDRRKVQAWLGHSLHMLDLRVCLSDKRVLWEDSVASFKKYSSVAHRTFAYRLLVHDTRYELMGGVADTMYADAFTRVYGGAFRSTYLLSLFGRTDADVDIASAAKLSLNTNFHHGFSSQGTDVLAAAVVLGNQTDLPWNGVYAVVMPPGHGKTYRHGRGRLREADQLCSPKASPALIRAKAAARDDPTEWPTYVWLWARELSRNAVSGDVVMVPDLDVAKAAGFCTIGAYLLDRSVWLGNLGDRTSVQVARCEVCYDSVQRAEGVMTYRCATNDQLTAVLDRCCSLLPTRD